MKRFAVALILVLPALALAQGGGGRRQTGPVPTGPAPRAANGHPDLTGYWRDDGNANPHGNLGKDYPDFKLPFTPAG